MNQFCQLNAKLFLLIYLLNNGLSSSVKNVTAFPLCPALPVRPKRNQTIKKQTKKLIFEGNGTFKIRIYKSLDFYSTENEHAEGTLVDVPRQMSGGWGWGHTTHLSCEYIPLSWLESHS